MNCASYFSDITGALYIMSLKKCNIKYFSPSVAMMYFQSRLMIILTLGPTSHSLASQATGSLFSLSLLHIVVVYVRIGA